MLECFLLLEDSEIKVTRRLKNDMIIDVIVLLDYKRLSSEKVPSWYLLVQSQ